MSNPWGLYQLQPSFILGFHGTEQSTIDELVNVPGKHLKKSQGKYEWLSHGIYFWENDPQRDLAGAAHPRRRQGLRRYVKIGFCGNFGYARN